MITERLKIRKFTNKDLTELYNLLSDEDVMEFIELPFSWEKTVNFLNSLALIDPPLIYVVEDFSQKFIGYVIFHEYDNDSFELGWILNKRYWWKGYANELTKAFIKRSSNIGKNLIIECAPNQENTKRIVALKEDTSEYVRKSVGNALRDISKKFPELIKVELCNWKLESKEINQVYKLVSKLVSWQLRVCRE